jgi:hypothetical protein
MIHKLESSAKGKGRRIHLFMHCGKALGISWRLTTPPAVDDSMHIREKGEKGYDWAVRCSVCFPSTTKVEP